PYPGRMGIKTLGGGSDGGDIDVNVAVPIIESIDVLQSGLTKKKGKVDADSTLNFYIDARNSGDIDDFWVNATVEIRCWYDQGSVQLASTPPAQLRANRNSYFLLNYTGGSNYGAGWSPGTWSVLFPDSSLSYLEADLLSQYEYTEKDVGDNRYHHHLYVNVTLGPQLRNASGPSGAWTDLGDDTPTLGFTNVYTWDVNATLTDIGNGIWDAKYTEFGIYKYISITSGGSPAGSFPPGGAAQMFTNPSTMTYSANCENAINVSMTNLLKVGDPTKWIDANKLAVQNFNGKLSDGSGGPFSYYSDIQSAGTNNWGDPVFFTGPGISNSLYAWGENVPPITYLASPGWGQYAFGPRSGDALDNNTLVMVGDQDAGLPLADLADATVTDQLTPDGRWEDGEWTYVDVDGSTDVSEGDIRITQYTSSSYPAGSEVAAGDPDKGTVLSEWISGNVTGGDGVWDPLTECVYDTGIDTDSVRTGQDTRVSTNPMVTAVYWWIQVPAGVDEGSYRGTITFTMGYA
ncbi:MAG: hypothetical protein KAT70_02560, partial [Thermoplasmata archaeon]|nr:hypothetical protein [Thermoplasmata archaeon]